MLSTGLVSSIIHSIHLECLAHRSRIICNEINFPSAQHTQNKKKTNADLAQLRN